MAMNNDQYQKISRYRSIVYDLFILCQLSQQSVLLKKKKNPIPGSNPGLSIAFGSLASPELEWLPSVFVGGST